jgi:hypothetical protein
MKLTTAWQQLTNSEEEKTNPVPNHPGWLRSADSAEESTSPVDPIVPEGRNSLSSKKGIDLK